jgi:hypothetical protein
VIYSYSGILPENKNKLNEDRYGNMTALKTWKCERTQTYMCICWMNGFI